MTTKRRTDNLPPGGCRKSHGPFVGWHKAEPHPPLFALWWMHKLILPTVKRHGDGTFATVSPGGLAPKRRGGFVTDRKEFYAMMSTQP